jgi:two-component system sensor histidine kinase DctS
MYNAVAQSKGFISRYRIWYWLPLLMILILLPIGLQTYQEVTKKEHQENIDVLTSDLYWLDQTIQSRLPHQQTQVLNLIQDVERLNLPHSAFSERGSKLIESNQELVSVSWFDAQGQLLSTTSPIKQKISKAPIERDLIEQSGLDAALAKRSLQNTGPFAMQDQTFEATSFQPIFDGKNNTVGLIKIQYNLSQMLDDVIPKWFVSKYHTHVFRKDTFIYTTQHDEHTRFDNTIPTVDRDIKLANTRLTFTVQIYPDGQAWVLRTLLLGMLGLLLALLISVLLLARDIGRRRATEKELRQQHNLRHAIENSLAIGVRAHSLDGAIIYTNPAFCNMIGYTPEEILYIPPPLSYIPLEEAKKLMAMRDMILAGGDLTTDHLEIKMRKKSGELIDTVMRGGLLYDEDQQRIGWITSVEDVTERKSLQAFQASEQKRLESINHLLNMGEMASSIAHELNQPLSAISGYATGLSNRIQKDSSSVSTEKLIEITEKIRRQAERAAHVARRVMQFVRQKEFSPRHTNVHEIIEQALEFMELELRQHQCTIGNEVAEVELPEVFVDSGMVQQTLINVIRNAIDAMNHHSNEKKIITITASKYSDQHILLGIFDNGPGIPAEKVEAVFQAFYTTKKNGVGIGLNICRTMIESNGGRMWAKADSAGGVFYITLPIATSSDTIE